MTWIEQPWAASSAAPVTAPVASPAKSGWADDEPTGSPVARSVRPVEVEEDPALSDKAREVIHALAALGIRVHLKPDGLMLEGPPDNYAEAAGLVMPCMAELMAHVQFLHDRHHADLLRLEAKNQRGAA